MNRIQIENILREHEKQRLKINQYQAQIKCLKNDNKTYQQIIIKLKQSISQHQQKIAQLNRELQMQSLQKLQNQNKYYLVLSKLEEEIEERKKKYNQLQNKIAPLIDYDSVRLKVLNEVEVTHHIELEQYQRKIQKLKDQVLKLKREKELIKHQYQTLKMNFDQQIRIIKNQREKNQSQQHLNLLSYQMCVQTEKKLRSNYQYARKQSQYYKQKYFDTEKKLNQKILFLEMELKQKNMNNY